jgi:hypothetical protein
MSVHDYSTPLLDTHSVSGSRDSYKNPEIYSQNPEFVPKTQKCSVYAQQGRVDSRYCPSSKPFYTVRVESKF